MKSEDFEQTVERLFRAIEGDGCKITWNRKIRDPDSDSIRQIDVEIIRKNGEICHVECRNRSSRQDVMWVEELLGRRTSLAVHEIMGVSATGFTEGAYRKAAVYGIQLWQLSHLDPEILRELIDPPDIYFCINSDVEILIKYFVARECLAGATEELIFSFREQIPEIIGRVVELLLRHSDREFQLQPTRAREVFSDIINAKSCRMKREVHIHFTTRYEKGKFDTLQGFRKGPPREKKIAAQIIVHGFSGIRAEFVLGAQRWMVSLDLKDIQHPKNTIIANEAIIASHSLPRKEIGFRIRKASGWDVDFPFKYLVLSET